MPEAPASHYETGTWHHCASTSPDGGELSARRRWAVKARRHYEAPRAAADGGTRLGGAESKRRRRSRLPAPPSRVTLLVYEFHDGPARELFKRYNYGQLDLAVAHAIVAGILDRSRLQGELVEALGRAIAFYEERGQT